MADPQEAQTLTDHLSELRDRLIKSLWVVAATTILAWNISDWILDRLVDPVRKFLPNGKLIFLNPMDMFVGYMKVSLIAGIIIACPILIYHLWKFVSPGLYDHEKKYGAAFIISGSGLFLTGISFAYFLVLPTGLEFLLNFGSSSGQAMITLPEYLSFFLTMILVFGASFELPLVIVILGLFGIVDQKFLREKRRYAVVLLATVAAVITPPDVLSMMMLLGPLWGLYEISIILVGVLGKRRNAATQEQAANAPQ
ncbi:MAG TPA: twin-arginine translocase subunit TatC [Bdellovibrionales bacterium]|nr:twin-arginine translocase subunit TatC [Bdellovibrionales bacterium]